ncbi:unnamed protein product [Rotaria socialis]|uniref:MACPF domain-containing protein n=1 Tax=Rotaria socialis TaxID=392032 RepID=A0A821LE05_9BILA|nr:unnamed protein product [Rotaria socialis]CAF4351117.1 unnamed protein product [Rotaria socialis]CAF4749529.1 unnamed protein product [Rotaria socialis]
MHQPIYMVLGVLSFYVQYVYLSSSSAKLFQFTEEARAALCPFVGTEGMKCFDDSPLKRSGRTFDTGYMQLPRSVGISIDRSTGLLKAPAVKLTYLPAGSRVWTDGYTGDMFDMINEAILGPASRVVSAYNAARVQIFQNASQLSAAWQQTFADGNVRGGELACPLDILAYVNSYFGHGEALALSQRPIGLYTMSLNASTVELNSFALRALSHLTAMFDIDLYEDFIDAWGTHIITKSLVGGMIEERAKVTRCFRAADNGMFARCIPFWDRRLISSSCAYYAAQTRVISKRLLGGNVQVDHEDEWKRTLAAGPALLQILEMVPWYDFVTDAAVKKNLHTVIRYRLRNVDNLQAQAVRQADARLSPCVSVPLSSAYIKFNSLWKKNGITVAGGNGAGSSINQLDGAHGLFIDDDQTLYIADYGNHRIVEWKAGATCGRVVAGGNGRGSRADQLNHAHDVIVDKVRDCLFIADWLNQRVVRWPLRGATIGEVIINDGAATYLAMDEQGFLYVTNWLGHEVKRWLVGETQGTVVAGGNGIGSRLNQLNSARKVFVDRDRSVYVSDWFNHRVMKWVEGAKEGIVVAGGRGMGNSLSQLNFPEGVIVDQFGTVYVADRYNHRIMRWPKGATEGEILVGGNGAGSTSSQLNEPIAYLPKILKDYPKYLQDLKEIGNIGSRLDLCPNYFHLLHLLNMI